MTIYLHNLRTCLRALLLPSVAALCVCLLCLQGVPHQAGTGVDRAAGYWLHVPGLLLVAASIAAALEGWPLFSRERPGAAFVLRVANRPLHGCVSAMLGCLTALAAALAGTGILFSFLLGAMGFDQGAVHTRIDLTALQSSARLDDQQRRLVFHTDDPTPVVRVRLRPIGIYTPGGDMGGARVQVLADDVPLHPGWLPTTSELVELAVTPPRPITRLEVRRREGVGLVLHLPIERVDVASILIRPGFVNCMLASLTYLAPALLAMAVMILGHAHLALPVNLAAGLVVCLLVTLLELTPNSQAITAFARGRWLGTEAIFMPLMNGVIAAGCLVGLRFAVGATAAGLVSGHRRH